MLMLQQAYNHIIGGHTQGKVVVAINDAIET